MDINKQTYRQHKTTDNNRYGPSKRNKKPEWLENSQLLRKTGHVNQIFELLEQCVANYYGDNRIAK